MTVNESGVLDTTPINKHEFNTLLSKVDKLEANLQRKTEALEKIVAMGVGDSGNTYNPISLFNTANEALAPPFKPEVGKLYKIDVDGKALPVICDEESYLMEGLRLPSKQEWIDVGAPIIESTQLHFKKSEGLELHCIAADNQILRVFSQLSDAEYHLVDRFYDTPGAYVISLTSTVQETTHDYVNPASKK